MDKASGKCKNFKDVKKEATAREDLPLSLNYYINIYDRMLLS